MEAMGFMEMKGILEILKAQSNKRLEETIEYIYYEIWGDHEDLPTEKYILECRSTYMKLQQVYYQRNKKHHSWI